jgi:hypothetical protein
MSRCAESILDRLDGQEGNVSFLIAPAKRVSAALA